MTLKRQQSVYSKKLSVVDMEELTRKEESMLADL